MNGTCTLEPPKRGNHSRQVFSAVELAGAVGLSPATIRRYMASGEIPGAFKIGSRWFVPKKSLTDWGL